MTYSVAIQICLALFGILVGWLSCVIWVTLGKKYQYKLITTILLLAVALLLLDTIT